MENKYDSIKSTLENFNNDIRRTASELSLIVHRLLTLADFKNKTVVCTTRFRTQYINKYEKEDEELIDVEFQTFIGHADIKLVSEKQGFYEEFGRIIKFLKSFFDLDDDVRKVRVNEGALKQQTGIMFNMYGLIGRLYELSEMDDDTLKLLIEMRK